MQSEDQNVNRTGWSTEILELLKCSTMGCSSSYINDSMQSEDQNVNRTGWSTEIVELLKHAPLWDVARVIIKNVFFGSQNLDHEKNSFRDFSELRQFYRISLKYGIGIADTHIIFQGYSKKMSELGEISKKRFLNLGTKKKHAYIANAILAISVAPTPITNAIYLSQCLKSWLYFP